MRHLIPDPCHLTSGRQPPDWCQPYIGIPFVDGGRTLQGADCYGLGWLVMASLGVELPVYDRAYERADDHQVTGRLIKAELADTDSRWVEVPWEERRAYDWVVYRRGDLPAHLALVGDRNWALHTLRDAGSGCEEFSRVALSHDYTSLGCYRHRGLAA